MSLSIDTYDGVSPSVFHGPRQLKLHIWWLGVTTSSVPSAIQVAIRQAKIQLERLGNERNAARWIALAYEIRNLWAKRSDKVEIAVATELFQQGWRMLSDWPLRPGFLGEPVFRVELGKRLDSNEKYMEPEFVWDTEADARPVPLRHIYELLGFSMIDGHVSERAWKVCFWLSFLSESELTDLANREKSRR